MWAEIIIVVFVIGITGWLYRYYATRIIIRTRINPADSAEMVWVPSGAFTMGAKANVLPRLFRRVADLCRLPLPDNYFGDFDAPPHIVWLDGYWIYRYEVTVAQYRVFARATNRPMPYLIPGMTAQHPVLYISWDDAEAYASWAGGSLPTEAQWEKAARGRDARYYPWGSRWNAMLCCNGKHTTPTPVGSFPRGMSPYGCYDMAGNVYEWCADLYSEDYYHVSPKRNPRGSPTGNLRVRRGGCWLIAGPYECRSTTRIVRDLIADRDVYTGFRCVINQQLSD